MISSNAILFYGKAVKVQVLAVGDEHPDVGNPAKNVPAGSCNGQAAAGGGAQVAWANARACRCGLRLTEEVKKALSRDRRRKLCGKAGRTQTQIVARAKGKSTRAAGAATSRKRKRVSTSSE